MKVLLTGFESFGQESINPSWEVAQRVAAALPDNIMVACRLLPTVFGKAIAEEIQHAGIPAKVSNSAGTFVCNHTMYGILHLNLMDCVKEIGIRALLDRFRISMTYLEHDPEQLRLLREAPGQLRLIYDDDWRQAAA